jgi:DUF4097 and DUF4098 domain-containing protein YvlB
MYLFLSILASSISFAALIQNDPSTEYREYDFNALEKIKIVNTSGKTTITPMPVNKVVISVQKKKFSDNCQLNIARNTIDEINTEVVAPNGETCEADINIQAPTDVALDMATGSGDVDIDGMKGNLKLATGTGSVHAKSSFKNLEVTSASGNVNLENLNSGGKVTTGSGKVDLKFLENPSGEFSVKTATGDADVHFPKGTKINADLDSKGMTDSEFTTYSNGYPVSVKSTSGDVEVRSY